MKKKIVLGILFVLLVGLVMPGVLAAGTINCSGPNLGSADATDCIKDKISSIINLLTMIAGGLAVIAAMVLGIMFLNTSDPGEKDRLGQRLKMLVVGIVIIALANPIVKALF